MPSPPHCRHLSSSFEESRLWSQPTTYRAEMRKRKTAEGITDASGFEPGSPLRSGRGSSYSSATEAGEHSIWPVADSLRLPPAQPLSPLLCQQCLIFLWGPPLSQFGQSSPTVSVGKSVGSMLCSKRVVHGKPPAKTKPRQPRVSGTPGKWVPFPARAGSCWWPSAHIPGSQCRPRGEESPEARRHFQPLAASQPTPRWLSSPLSVLVAFL